MTETVPPGWQRLSLWALLPRGLKLANQVFRQYLPAMVGVGAGLTIVGGFGLRELSLAGLAVVLLGLLYLLAWHRRFRFRIETGGIRVREGVLQRRELRIGWGRVRNVDIRQVFFLRPLGLATLILETVGGESEEVSLTAIPLSTAEAVRAQVASPDIDEEGEQAPAEDILHQPSSGAIFLHGLTSGQIWLFLAALGGIYGSFHRHLSPRLEAGIERLSGGLAIEAGLGTLAMVVLGLVLVAGLLVLISGLVAILRFHAFVLHRDAERLRARHGLFETRERSLSSRKLQVMTLVEPLIGRWLGRCYLLGHQASAALASEGEGGDGTVVVPALTPAEAGEILAWLDSRYAASPAMQGIHPGFRRFWGSRLWLLGLILMLVILATGIVGSLLGSAVMLALLLIGPLALRWLVARRWAAWRWGFDGDMLHIESGLWGRRRDIFDIHRVQQVRLQQNPYQRYIGVVNMQLFLADGPRTIPFLPETQAIRMANRVIYEVERAPINVI